MRRKDGESRAARAPGGLLGVLTWEKSSPCGRERDGVAVRSLPRVADGREGPGNHGEAERAGDNSAVGGRRPGSPETHGEAERAGDNSAVGGRRPRSPENHGGDESVSGRVRE